MSNFRVSAATLALAALTTYGNANAQQFAPQPAELPNNQQSENTPDTQRSPGQQSTQQSTQQSADQERYEARRVSSDRQQKPLTIKETLVKRLQKANTAEIELATLAQERSDNQEIQQLAKTLISDHKAMNQKLEQYLSNQQSQGNAGQQDRTGTDRAASDRVNPDQPATDRRDAIARTQDAAGDRASGQRGGDFTAEVPAQMCQIMDQAMTNSLQMTKQMLQSYEGQNFQMAFLGHQMVAHTMMLAELRAIESTGPQDLQPIVQEAIAKTESHLQTIKQLASKFQDESGNQNRRG